MSGVISIIIIVAVVTLIIIRHIKRNKAITELRISNSSAVALIIMRELTTKGYLLGHKRVDFEKGKAVGNLVVSYDADHDGYYKPKYCVGFIEYCKDPYVPESAESCDVHIKEIGLFVRIEKYNTSIDEFKSEFIETAANVIKDYIEDLKGRGVIISDFKIS